MLLLMTYVSFRQEKDEDVVEFCARIGLIGSQKDVVERAKGDLLAGGVYDQHNRTTGRRLAFQLAKYYGDALPDPELQAKLEASDALYEQDDNGMYELPLYI